MKRICPNCKRTFIDNPREGRGIVVGMVCPWCDEPMNVYVDKDLKEEEVK